MVPTLLQGGYNLEATAAGVEACLRVCLGERPPPLRPDGGALPAPSAPGLAAIRESLVVQVGLAQLLPGHCCLVDVAWSLVDPPESLVATKGLATCWPLFARQTVCDVVLAAV